MYRFLVLSMVAYLLAHWAHLWSGGGTLPNWGEVSRLAIDPLFPQLALLVLLMNMKRLRSVARTQGLDLTVTGWQYG